MLLAPFFRKNLSTLSSSESFVLKRFFLLGLSSSEEIRLSGFSKFNLEFLQYIVFVSGSWCFSIFSISSEFNGRIKSIEVSEGDEIDEGQIVAILE